MNKFPKSLILTAVIASVASIPLGQKLVKAQEAEMAKCIKEYTGKLGISADAALGECKTNNLINCIKSLNSKKYVAKSVSQSKGLYLVDLGNNDNRWMEGKGWNEKECQAYTDGPYKRQSDRLGGDVARSYEWFRQGWCKKPQIELDQTYSIDEAKIICELGLEI